MKVKNHTTIHLTLRKEIIQSLDDMLVETKTRPRLINEIIIDYIKAKNGKDLSYLIQKPKQKVKRIRSGYNLPVIMIREFDQLVEADGLSKSSVIEELIGDFIKRKKSINVEQSIINAIDKYDQHSKDKSAKLIAAKKANQTKNEYEQ